MEIAYYLEKAVAMLRRMDLHLLSLFHLVNHFLQIDLIGILARLLAQSRHQRQLLQRFMAAIGLLDKSRPGHEDSPGFHRSRKRGTA